MDVLKDVEVKHGDWSPESGLKSFAADLREGGVMLVTFGDRSGSGRDA